jgi:hypothetical protein
VPPLALPAPSAAAAGPRNLHTIRLAFLAYPRNAFNLRCRSTVKTNDVKTNDVETNDVETNDVETNDAPRATPLGACTQKQYA